MGLDNEDLVDLVGQDLIQDMQHKHIANLELVKIGEEPGAWQAPVSGEHTVASRTANGQAGPVQMPHGDLQDGLLSAVIDGQHHIDHGDLDIAHDAVAADIQQGFVDLLLLVRQKEIVGTVEQRLVIILGGVPKFLILCVIDICHLFLVAGNGPGGVERVPPIGEGGVQH